MTPPSSVPGSAAVRVLIVEDDELSAQAHAAYVRRTAGFEVAGVARSTVEALRLLRGRPEVHLVLLDMNLPDGHGLALLRTMRAEGHLCDVIAVTAARDVEVVKRAVASGVVLYLLKPFTYAGFRTKLDQYAGYRERLADGADLGQEDVDRVLGSLRTAHAPDRLPKAARRPTLRPLPSPRSRRRRRRNANHIACTAPPPGLARLPRNEKPRTRRRRCRR